MTPRARRTLPYFPTRFLQLLDHLIACIGFKIESQPTPPSYSRSALAHGDASTLAWNKQTATSLFEKEDALPIMTPRKKCAPLPWINTLGRKKTCSRSPAARSSQRGPWETVNYEHLPVPCTTNTKEPSSQDKLTYSKYLSRAGSFERCNAHYAVELFTKNNSIRMRVPHIRQRVAHVAEKLDRHSRERLSTTIRSRANRIDPRCSTHKRHQHLQSRS